MGITRDPTPSQKTILSGKRPFDRNVFDLAVFDVAALRLVPLTKDTAPPQV